MLDIPSFGVLWGKCWISNLLVFYGGNAGYPIFWFSMGVMLDGYPIFWCTMR